MGHELSNSFSINNVIKQGCVLATTLFGFFFAAVIQAANEDAVSEIFIQKRTDG